MHGDGTRRLSTDRIWRSIVAALALLIVMPGCGLRRWIHNGFRVGPNYRRARAEVGQLWIDSDDKRVDTAQESDVEWWRALRDPTLDQLIETAHAQNLSLRQAGWRVMQARAIRAIAVGNLFPQSQIAFTEFDRSLFSETVAEPNPLRAYSDWSTGFDLAWELDVWGRYRRSIDSSDADLQATIGDYDAVLLSLIADVASAYVDYRTTEARLAYAKNNIEIQKNSLRLTQTKADTGASSYTGVYLAKSSLESTRAAVPSLEIELRQSANQLCVLLGIPPQRLDELLGSGSIPAVPAQVAVGIPANLLRRRPDVRAAEWSVVAQNEQIGIAEADLYPSFTLTGEIALESEDFGDLFQSASSAGFIGPGFQWNVLNYGRLQNNVLLQEYSVRELVDNYRNTILVANQEAEDALIAFLKTEERLRNLRASVDATSEALRLLTISYEEGEIDFGNVFLLQGSLVTAQDRLAEARGDVVLNLIDLYRALGGGWEVRCQGFQSILEPVDAGMILEPAPIPDGEIPLSETPERPMGADRTPGPQSSGEQYDALIPTETTKTPAEIPDNSDLPPLQSINEGGNADPVNESNPQPPAVPDEAAD